MAKRKRLTPVPQAAPETDLSEAAPETKSIFPSYRDGFVGYGPKATPRAAPPIADVAGEASAAAAFDEMAETLRSARERGRMVVDLALGAVEQGYLVRDRLASDPAEMESLVESLRARGQQTPIEVAPLGSERYGLISGWRRLTALSRLHAETGDERFATVQALIRQPTEAADAYLAMVEENEIRVGLSYYERARIVAKATEQGVYGSEKAALRALFSAASRPRRSKIGSFLTLVHALEGALRFPEAIGERLGLSLAKALEDDPEFARTLRESLEREAPQNPEAEQALLSHAAERIADPAASSGTIPRNVRPDAPKKARKAAQETSQGSPTVHLEAQADGSLVLSGPGVDAAFRSRLEAWLAGGTD